MVDQFIRIGSGHAIPGGAPSWYLAKPPLDWSQIGSNTYEDVAPAFDFSDVNSAFDDWNGLATNQLRREIGGGGLGGHTASGYQANHMTTFQLGDEDPRWIRRTDASEEDDELEDSANEGLKVDGTPITTHTYQNSVFAWDRFYQCMQGSVYDNGHGTGRIAYWDRSNFTVSTGSRGWTNLGISPTDVEVYDGFAGWDPITDIIWYGQRREPTGSGKSQFGTISQGGTLTRINLACGGIGSTASYSAGVIIHRGSESVLLVFGDLLRRVINCQNPTALHTPTFSGSVLPRAMDGVVYNPRTQQLIAWRPDTLDLLVCDVPANLLTGNYVWNVVPTGGSISGTAPANGMFNKFNICHDMGDDSAALTIVTRTNQPVSIMRLPEEPLQ